MDWISKSYLVNGGDVRIECKYEVNWSCWMSLDSGCLVGIGVFDKVDFIDVFVNNVGSVNLYIGTWNDVLVWQFDIRKVNVELTLWWICIRMIGVCLYKVLMNLYVFCSKQEIFIENVFLWFRGFFLFDTCLLILYF